MLPDCFRFRPAEEVNKYKGTYEYYALIAMSKKSNLPIRAWQDLKLGVTADDRVAYERCNAYKDKVVENVRNGVGLFIYGGVGSGKTVWTYKIARHYMESIASTWESGKSPNPIYFANVPRLLNDLKGAFQDDKLMESIDNAVMNSDLVIFDDLGAENATEWARERLYQYIDYRYANMKACLFTSNKDIRLIEERIADRVRGTCEIVEFRMSSKRILGAQGGK